jgi:hypothetical protein
MQILAYNKYNFAHWFIQGEYAEPGREDTSVFVHLAGPVCEPPPHAPITLPYAGLPCPLAVIYRPARQQIPSARRRTRRRPARATRTRAPCSLRVGSPRFTSRPSALRSQTHPCRRMRRSLRVQLYSAAEKSGGGDMLGRGLGGGCRQATIARDPALAQAGVESCGQPGSDPNTSRLLMLVFGGVSSLFLAAVEQMGALDRFVAG